MGLFLLLGYKSMTVLLAQVHTLKQQVETLADMFSALGNPLIEHIVARMRDLEDAIEGLPEEPEATRWWIWHSQAHLIRNLLTPIQGYARLMHIQPSQLELTSYTDEQDAQFECVNACVNACRLRISSCPKRHKRMQTFANDELIDCTCVWAQARTGHPPRSCTMLWMALARV